LFSHEVYGFNGLRKISVCDNGNKNNYFIDFVFNVFEHKRVESIEIGGVNRLSTSKRYLFSAKINTFTGVQVDA